MKKSIHIYVACGAGVATSTVAAERVKEICAEEGINAVVNKGTIQDIPIVAASVDLILTTNTYREPIDKPYMSIVSLISGIRENETIQKLKDLIHKIINE